MRKICESMLDSLRKGEIPRATWEDIACFAPEALAGNPHVEPSSLSEVLASLSADDIPTLERAIKAISADEPAWLGFKVVYDPRAALSSVDTEVVGMTDRGSADDRCGVFLANADGDIVFGRPYSERDRFQMLDITRGPGMHDEQYAGVVWLAVPLFASGRVFILGGGNVGSDLSRICDIIGFETTVADDDEAYLDAERFPFSRRVLVDDFANLGSFLDARPEDYVCVLTRGHMHDPEGVAYGIDCGARYVGMMGCAEKNARVQKMILERGYTSEQVEAVLHAPIGLEFGAKTTAELALCIAAQLVEIRTQRRGLPLTHS